MDGMGGSLQRASDSDDLERVLQDVSSIMDRYVERRGGILQQLRRAHAHLVIAKNLVDDANEGWEE